MLWKILLFIKLFHSFNKFILFLFQYICVLCSTHDVIVTHDVVGDYVYEVWDVMILLCLGRWKSQFYSLLIMFMWQILCHWTRCYWPLLFINLVIMVHGVIMEPWGCQGGYQSPVVVGSYLSFSSGDLASTSSHICGSWYLPIYLFRDGSWTLINIASLMALAIFWSSLPTMLKLSRDSSCII